MPKRFQRSRKDGSRMPPGCIYVGRPSKWGSPFDWNDWVRCGHSEESAKRLAAIEFGKVWSGEWSTASPEQFAAIDEMREHVHELKDKNICCWCRLDDPCHGDVLLAAALTDGRRRYSPAASVSVGIVWASNKET